MKKLLSISLGLLMLFSGMQLTISMHYCGGELADSKVSVLGSVASCGMEVTSDECTRPGSRLNTHCCDNNISVYSIDHNYSPSFSEFKAFTKSALLVFLLPKTITSHVLISLFQNISGVSPPGTLQTNAVSLPKICVFRI